MYSTHQQYLIGGRDVHPNLDLFDVLLRQQVAHSLQLLAIEVAQALRYAAQLSLCRHQQHAAAETACLVAKVTLLWSKELDGCISVCLSCRT